MQSNNKKILIGFIVIALIALVVVGVTATNRTSNTSSNVVSSTVSANYKDGEYSAQGDYQSPGGSQSITIKVTIKNGQITDTTATPGAKDQNSELFQSQFIDGYKSLIIGKNLSTIKLDRVSGSSLTSQGFNKAIDQIKSQAQS